MVITLKKVYLDVARIYILIAIPS